MAIRDQVKEALNAVVEVRSDVLRPQVQLPAEAKELAEILTSAADKIKPNVAGYFTGWPPRTLPANIVVVDGNNQTANTGQAVPDPIEVFVTDAAGNGVPNVVVQFSVLVGSGRVVNSTMRTDGNGVAILPGGSWRLGKQGSNLLRASAFAATGPISVNIEATAK